MAQQNETSKVHNSLCRFRILQAYDGLSSTERQIADYLLENEKKIAGKTSSEIAELTKTSTASVVRFCRAVGFLGVSDLKLSIMRDVLSPDANYMDLGKDDSVSAIKQKVIEFNKSTIDKLLLDHDEENIQKAADAIESAGLVTIIGDGGSGGSAKIAFDIFLQMKIPSSHIADPMYEILAISMMKPGDVLFVVNNSGRNRNIVENAKYAHQLGITTIGIVGRSGTALGQYLDIEFHAGQHAQGYFSETLGARICELCVLSVLYSVLSLKHDKLTETYRKQVNDTLDLKRLAPRKKI